MDAQTVGVDVERSVSDLTAPLSVGQLSEFAYLSSEALVGGTRFPQLTGSSGSIASVGENPLQCAEQKSGLAGPQVSVLTSWEQRCDLDDSRDRPTKQPAMHSGRKPNEERSRTTRLQRRTS